MSLPGPMARAPMWVMWQYCLCLVNLPGSAGTIMLSSSWTKVNFTVQDTSAGYGSRRCLRHFGIACGGKYPAVMGGLRAQRSGARSRV